MSRFCFHPKDLFSSELSFYLLVCLFVYILISGSKIHFLSVKVTVFSIFFPTYRAGAYALEEDSVLGRLEKRRLRGN